MLINNNQHCLSRKFIFKFEFGAFKSALVYICFNNQTLGSQNCSVACFDQCLLIMLNERSCMMTHKCLSSVALALCTTSLQSLTVPQDLNRHLYGIIIIMQLTVEEIIFLIQLTLEHMFSRSQWNCHSYVFIKNVCL